MPLEVDLTVIRDFATAILIGALLGIERERSKHERVNLPIGGLRTFILFALIGALGGWLTLALASPWVLVAALLMALTPVLAGYVVAARQHHDSLGLTTEMAAIAACLLGAMTTLGYRDLAVGLGVTVAALLAYKQPLHGVVQRLDREDVYAGLRLLIATFIVLPLLPDRVIDPWGALNPRALWMLVLGTQRGIPLTGATGGLVSSTAVTLTFARQSRDPSYAGAAPALASGVVLSWAVMFARILVEVLVVNRSLLPAVLAPFAAMATAAACMAWYFRSRAESAGRSENLALRNPFSLTASAKFAAFFALVLLVVKLAQSYAPASGIYFVAGLAGTTDVDAITLSMAQYAKAGDATIAARAITIAALTNTIVKTALVTVLGSPALRKSALIAAVAITAAGAAAILVS
jgi:uncharacterized membrane protein (DUF4010 family)